MSKAARLQSAQATQWVEKYTGKNVVRGYCRWYGVDELCAVIELKQLDVPIPAEREAELRQKAAKRTVTATKRKRGKNERDTFDEYPESDGTFAFIAGYTPVGFAYGITWEELEETPPWVDENESEQDTSSIIQ